jgi:hypothetical protein
MYSFARSSANLPTKVSGGAARSSSIVGRDAAAVNSSMTCCALLACPDAVRCP